MHKRTNTLPLSRTALVDRLDTQVDECCTRFYEAWLDSPAFGVCPETGRPLELGSDSADEALLQLVFMADARAQADNNQFRIVSNIAWAEFARRGVKRMSQRIESMRGLHQLRVLVGADMAMQAGAYKDMSDHRVTAEGVAVRSSTGLTYATRVAMGDIILEQKAT